MTALPSGQEGLKFEAHGEPIILSALNQFLFCPRRCALIHVEGVFEENAFTLEGSLLHDRTDTPGVAERPGVRIVRALPLFSRRLGLIGKADIVEFHRQPDGSERPYPVEYKRGRRRRWDNDDVQLCAQALCLEEMLGLAVPVGAVFHAASKRRREVPFDGKMRLLTEQTVGQVRELIASGRVPLAALMPKCGGCSLRVACMPEITEHPDRVAAFAHGVFRWETAG
jgi:CRISPR-associated exonuclease Cas4